MASNEAVTDEEYEFLELPEDDIPLDGTQVDDDLDLSNVDDSEKIDVEETTLEAESKPDEPKKPAAPKRRRKDYDKRINELIYQRKSQEEQTAAVYAAYDLAQQEIAELRERAARGVPGDDPVATLEREEQNALREREEATDREDFRALNKANDRLAEIRMKKWQAQQRPAQEPEKPAERPAPAQQQPGQQQIHPAAKRWLDDNPWYSDEANANLAHEALVLHNQLLRTGRFPVGQDLYDELDRELRERPEFDHVLYTQQAAPEPPARPTPSPRGRVASPSRGGGTPPAGREKRPNQYEIAAMRMAHLDPTDKKHVAAFQKYRISQ